MLSSLLGDAPISMVVSTYNQWASAHKFSKRTKKSLTSRARYLGVSTQTCGTWIAYSILIEALGSRVKKWIDNKELVSKKDGRRRFIRRSDLRAFARKHPDRFSNMELSDLVMIFDSTALAEQLAEQPKASRRGVPLKVRCKETGKIYPTIASAAKAHFVSETTMRRYVAAGKGTCGRTFVLVSH